MNFHPLTAKNSTVIFTHPPKSSPAWRRRRPSRWPALRRSNSWIVVYMSSQRLLLRRLYNFMYGAVQMLIFIYLFTSLLIYLLFIFEAQGLENWSYQCKWLRWRFMWCSSILCNSPCVALPVPVILVRPHKVNYRWTVTGSLDYRLLFL